ncbi:MAG: phosphodiester glycosidase family protein [Candidatus Obscuribacterales bacterium]|nr:phosphodiester glycosidase family protein [Candidatus Obscuribacterales bacterium]
MRPKSSRRISLSILSLTAVTMMSAASTESKLLPKSSWRELSDSKNLSPNNGACYFEFKLENGSTAHLVVASISDGKWRLRPYLADKTTPTSTIGKEEKASAAINGGFFNLSDGQSASYIYLDGQLKADPRKNKALVENPKLEPFLEQIFNRSELRVLQKGKNKATELQIAKHNDVVPPGYKLLDSLQAGPQLLPTLECESEAFLRKQADGSLSDSIGCRKPAARSAIGITRDGYLLILAVSGKGQDQESSGITLAETADLLRRLGCRQALNLDGGSSTSLFVRRAEAENANGSSVCAKDPETRVKTMLLLMPQ